MPNSARLWLEFVMRKARFLLLMLILLGAYGAFATGFVPWQLPWHPDAEPKPNTTRKTTGKTATVKQETSKQASTNTKTTSVATTANGVYDRKDSPFGIDFARINSTGSSVIAGFSKPGAPLTIFADGKPIGVVTADQSGDWIFVTPRKFASLDPYLTIRAGDHMPRTPTAQSSGSSSTASRGQRVDAAAPRRPTAEDVRQQMLRRMEKLTEEARTQFHPAISANPSPPAKSAAGRTASSSANPKSIVTGSVMGQAENPKAKQTRVAAAVPAASKPESGTAAGLPVPVQFVYGKTDLTEKGREAASVLLAYLKAKRFKTVVLSGHADERGPDLANMELSRRRLERIEDVLREGGFKGELKLVPMGEAQKFTGVDRSQFDVEELWQLDRRVEVVSAE
jgi:outer membrane protein OmpA-like peptidoglycan-associated protein